MIIVCYVASCYNFIISGESSSGRTADSGSVSEGSNPSSPATNFKNSITTFQFQVSNIILLYYL
jgi:hypothetical protein